MASPAHPDIPSALLARFAQAVKELTARAGPFPDDLVDKELRKWLDGEDQPLAWQNSSGITPDEYFFITTLYGHMNSAGRRTMIRKFFGPLFVQAANGDIRGFFPETSGYEGLRAPFMKARLCKMGKILRERGMSMTEYVEELRSLQRDATPQNLTAALDRIIQDHQATSWKTLSVFVRDCVRVNCFPIDLRVRRQLEKYQLPEDEGRLVRMCLALDQSPREVARIFFEAEPGEKKHLDPLLRLDEAEPSVFYTWEGEGWVREPCGKLIRQQDTLSFDALDEEGSWKPERMTLEGDGLYHWRQSGGPGHWWGFLSETETHTYLACNYINPDGRQGFQVFVWPK